HLQNRLRCQFSEAVFESLLMYFRSKNEDDVQRVLKARLGNRAFLDQGLEFLPAAERYQFNAQLAELGLRENDRSISDNSSTYRQNQNYSRDRTEKTKFQVMAEVNAGTALVSAGLAQSYEYKKHEYR